MRPRVRARDSGVFVQFSGLVTTSYTVSADWVKAVSEVVVTMPYLALLSC